MHHLAIVSKTKDAFKIARPILTLSLCKCESAFEKKKNWLPGTQFFKVAQFLSVTKFSIFAKLIPGESR